MPAAGIVTGIGLVHGTPCMVIANDATVKGGSFFHETVRKHLRAQEIARENLLPCLYLVDCGGAYLPEQDRVFPDRGHFGSTFYEQCRMSADGIPQISAVFGGCTAGGAYIPALSDEVVMVQGNARIHLGGPSIVKAAINEDVDGETLGGAAMHTRVSGVSDYLASDEAEALARLREIVAGLNQRRPCYAAVREARPPLHDPGEIGGILEADPRVPYDVREVIGRLVDGSEAAEFKPDWGSSLVCCTAHLHGYPVGLLANNGPLFSESSAKGAHFIELCDQRHIPLAVPAEHHRLHGGHGRRARRHRQAQRQAGVRRILRPCAAFHRHHRRQLRRGQLRHVRTRLRPAFPVRMAQCPDRDHEPGHRGQRSVGAAPRQREARHGR